jgi:Zn-dependent peptidase ImmA (M78 family)
MVTVRGILSGAVAIDKHLARALTDAIGGTSNFWLRRQANYEEALERAAVSAAKSEADVWLDRVPLTGARRVGRLTDGKRLSEIRQRLAFFNVANFDAWQARYGRLYQGTRFRTSQRFMSNSGAVLLWLRQGELTADLTSTEAWNPDNLRDRLESIRGLTKISQPVRFMPKLRALCAAAGVAVVVVKAPRGCHASGASRLVAPDKAMILLSFRFRADDQFWFTVFHEIGHLLLHGANSFVDDPSTPEDKSEQEANDFARSCLIPESRKAEFSRLSANRTAVLRFSVSAGIAPGLTVGQMQRAQMIPHKTLNTLKRYWTWGDIEPAIA